MPLNLDAQEEALHEFFDLLKTSRGVHDLSAWAVAANGRDNLLANLALGQIRWPKSLGHPQGNQLFKGFVFHRSFWVDIWHIGPDGEIVTDINGWTPGDAPTVWDGPEEPEHYSVKYLISVSDQNDNKIEVGFSRQPWHREGRFNPRFAHRYLSVQGWQFYGGGKFIALPDITIDRQPFVHV